MGALLTVEKPNWWFVRLPCPEFSFKFTASGSVGCTVVFDWTRSVCQTMHTRWVVCKRKPFATGDADTQRRRASEHQQSDVGAATHGDPGRSQPTNHPHPGGSRPSASEQGQAALDGQQKRICNGSVTFQCTTSKAIGLVPPSASRLKIQSILQFQ